jgi:hypothetical protein
MTSRKVFESRRPWPVLGNYRANMTGETEESSKNSEETFSKSIRILGLSNTNTILFVYTYV